MASSITSHLSYRCAACQTDLHFSPLACVDKSHFIFNQAHESSINEQRVGFFGAVFPSKMRVSCRNCKAKLGHSGRGLSFLDRKLYCFKIRSDTLDVINNKVVKDAGTESLNGEARKEADRVKEFSSQSITAPRSAAAQEAKRKEIDAFRRKVLEKIHRRKRSAAVLRALLVTWPATNY